MHKQADNSWLSDAAVLNKTSWPRVGDTTMKLHKFRLAFDGAKQFFEFRLIQKICYAGSDENKLIVRQHQQRNRWVDQSLECGIPRVHWRPARSSSEVPDEESLGGSLCRCLSFATLSPWAVAWLLSRWAATATGPGVAAAAATMLKEFIDFAAKDLSMDLAMTRSATVEP